MFKNTWLKNLVISFGIALIAPLVFKLVLVEQEVVLDSATYIKLFALTGLLGLVNLTLAQLFRPKKKKSKYKGATFTAEDLKNLPEEEGTVKWFNLNKGFGFIVRDAGGEVFVHFRSIKGVGHRSLREGQRVRFVALASHKGMQAEEVIVLEG